MNIVTWCHRVENKVKAKVRLWTQLKDWETEQLTLGKLKPEEAKWLNVNITAMAEEAIYAEEEEALRHMDRLKHIAANAMKLQEKWYLVTWRPPMNSKLSCFNIVETYLRKDYILEWEAVVEQKGTTPETLGQGLHAHMIVKSQHYPSDFTRNTLTHFGKSGMIQIGNRFCKYLKTAKDLEFAKAYIRGDKHDESKAAAVLGDKEYRRANGLKDLYQSSTDGTGLILQRGALTWD